MRYATFALVSTIVVAGAAARGNITVPVQSAVRGMSGTGLTSGAPAKAFSFDYRSSITKDTAPYEPASMTLAFEASQAPFSELKIQLDSSPTPFTFLPYPGNGNQVLYTLYDPGYELSPGSPWPATPAFLAMPSVWRDDLADGVLSGKFWVTNPVGTPNTYFLSTQGIFAVSDGGAEEGASPEPGAGLAIVAMAGVLLRRVRRSRRR